MSRAPDVALRIGMPVVFFRQDLEAALDSLLSTGDFQGVGLHISQLGPGPESVVIGEKHAEASGNRVRALGLTMSSFNVTGDFSFDPFTSDETFSRSVEKVAYWLRLGAAMGAPRVMMWDGVTDRVETAMARLDDCITAGRIRSGLSSPPSLTLELHPFTFALKHRRVDEFITALAAIGDVSLCWDFAHFAVALGLDFIEHLPLDFIDSVGEVHYCDSDGSTSELHFPPGEGALDLAAFEATIASRPIPILWDLFSWPTPRDAIRRYMPAYADAIRRQRERLAVDEA